jgi:1-phosphatidylinositol-4-phosphate 5-kinase
LQYGFIKRAEHFVKGFLNPESQISAIPPERYGDRFIRFISGITMSKEEAEKQQAEEAQKPNKSATDVVMEKAERQAEISVAKGSSEENVPERKLNTVRSPSADRGELGYTLPVVEEAAESGSVGGRSGKSASSDPASAQPGLRPPPTPPKDQGKDWNEPEERPPTPPKDKFKRNPEGPPTPPKDEKYRRMEEVGVRIGPLR